MRIEEHYENFMNQPDVEKYVELYCSILENESDDWLQIYYELMREITKDRALFVTPAEQLKEYGKCEISQKQHLVSILKSAL